MRLDLQNLRTHLCSLIFYGQWHGANKHGIGKHIWNKEYKNHRLFGPRQLQLIGDFSSQDVMPHTRFPM